MPRRKCAFAFNNGKLIKQRDLENMVARKKKGKKLKSLQSLEALKRYFLIQSNVNSFGFNVQQLFHIIEKSLAFHKFLVKFCATIDNSGFD